MVIESVALGFLEVNCYIISSGNECVVIDPGDHPEPALKKIGKKKINCVVLTHGHIDHIMGLKYFRERNIDILIGEKDGEMLLDPKKNLSNLLSVEFSLDKPANRLLKENDIIKIGSEQLTVIDLPGHSPGGIGLLADNFLIAGDTIFQYSVGRTDIPGGNTKQLKSTIYNKVYKLPNDTIIYPGHGDKTTVGIEKKKNLVFPL